MRTHRAERSGAAVAALGGASPPSGVDTVDKSLSQPDEAPMPAVLGLANEL
jgi:hypothetical protein